jgi:aminoglycoside 6'-N-acetyltransferase I
MSETAQITLRAARPEDLPGLAVLGAQVFVDTYADAGIRPTVAREVLSQFAPDALAALLARPGGACIVAERAGHLIGFALLRQAAGHALLGEGAAAELEKLYVQRPFLGQGLGRRLLRAAEQEAARGGATRLWLTAWVGNARALAFCARQGYAEIGVDWHEFEDERHENRLFVKTLAAAPARPDPVASAPPHIEACSDPADPRWLALRLALWPGPPEEHRADMAEVAAEPARYAQFLALDGPGGEALGLAEVALRQDYVNGTEGSPVGFLEGLYVRPEVRRRGVAGALVRAASDWVLAQGCGEIASDTALENLVSQALHRALGFEETERVVYFRRRLNRRA